MATQEVQEEEEDMEVTEEVMAVVMVVTAMDMVMVNLKRDTFLPETLLPYR